MLERTTHLLLVLVLFLLPWQTQWIIHQDSMAGSIWQYGTLSLFVSDVPVMVLMIISLFPDMFFSSVMGRLSPRRWFESHPLAVMMALFIGWSFLSIAWSPNRLVALEHALWLTEAAALCWLIVHDKGHRQLIVWSFLVGVFFQAVVGITQFVIQMGYASTIMGWALHDPAQLGTSVIDTGIRRWLRAYGGLPHPNMFGGLMAIGLLLYAQELNRMRALLRAKFESSRGLWPLIGTIGLWLGYAAILIALLVSFSRSAWMAFGMGCILWFAITRPRPVKQLLITFIVIFIIIAPFWEPFSTRLSLHERLETKSIDERAGGYREAWSLIKRHPWIGVGIGNYTNTLQAIDTHPLVNDLMTNIPVKKKAWDYQPVHNAFVLMLTELGIIGCLLVFVMVWYIFRLKNHRRFLLLTSYFLLPVLVIALLDHYLWSLHVGILMVAVMVALTMIGDGDRIQL